MLAQQTSLDQNLDGGDIKNAFQKSGLFLEASLASGSVPSTRRSRSEGRADRAAPDAAVGRSAHEGRGERRRRRAAKRRRRAITVDAGPRRRQRFPTSTSRNPAAAGARCRVADILLAPRPCRAASRLALRWTPGLRTQARRSICCRRRCRRSATRRGNAGSCRKICRDDDVTVHTNTPPPPFRGALPSAQPVASPSIAPDAPLATTAHHLLDDTDAAIARQTLLQVASLPDRIDTAAPHRYHRAALEFRNSVRDAAGHGDGAVRDFARRRRQRGRGGQTGLAGAVLARRRAGRPGACAGVAHGDTTSVRMWAERPATAAQLRAGAANSARR